MIRLVSRCLLLLCLSASLPVAAQRVSYAWHNVRIGGGGYVSGLVFHPAEKGLYYARTDVGGAYRWDAAAAHWVPLTDWIGAKDHNLMGIDSLALDPADPDWLYLAAGTYTVPQAGNAAILRSHDRGHSFQRVDLPFPLGGNELGRGNGERLAVDPNDGGILFLGSRTAGLWRSADHAAHWSRVDSFPAVATSLAATAINSWRRQSIGIVFVVFDPANGKQGQPTPLLYAGVSTRQTSLYRSSDGGAHWSAVPGQPTGLRPNHMTRGARRQLLPDLRRRARAGPDARWRGVEVQPGRWPLDRHHADPPPRPAERLRLGRHRGGRARPEHPARHHVLPLHPVRRDLPQHRWRPALGGGVPALVVRSFECAVDARPSPALDERHRDRSVRSGPRAVRHRLRHLGLAQHARFRSRRHGGLVVPGHRTGRDRAAGSGQSRRGCAPAQRGRRSGRLPS